MLSPEESATFGQGTTSASPARLPQNSCLRGPGMLETLTFIARPARPIVVISVFSLDASRNSERRQDLGGVLQQRTPGPSRAWRLLGRAAAASWVSANRGVADRRCRSPAGVNIVEMLLAGLAWRRRAGIAIGTPATSVVFRQLVVGEQPAPQCAPGQG